MMEFEVSGGQHLATPGLNNQKHKGIFEGSHSSRSLYICTKKIKATGLAAFLSETFNWKSELKKLVK